MTVVNPFAGVSEFEAARARLADPKVAARVDADLAAAERAADEQWLHARQQQRRDHLAAIRPLDFDQANLGGLREWQDPARKVSTFLRSDARQLVLVGPSGHGKSWAAWAVANTAVDEDGMIVDGWNVPDLIAALRGRDAHARYDTEAARKQDKARGRLFTVDLLLLDDLGAERADASFEHNEWRELVYRVIDNRAREGLRTVVTCNAPTEDDAFPIIEQRYGARVRTRLLHRAWWAFIRGEQLRKPTAPWNEGGAQ